MTNARHPDPDGPAPARGFGDAIATCLERYATFTGRASRSEFWYFVLAAVLINLAVALITPFVFVDSPEVGASVSLLVSLGLAIPVIAAGVRRLHDTGRSGWWYLLAVVPLANIVLLVLLAEPPALTHPAPRPPAASAPLPPADTAGTVAPPPQAGATPRSGWEAAPRRADAGRFVALWLTVGALVVSNVAAWVMVGTLWRERTDTRANTGGETIASELRTADRRIEELEDDLAEAKLGSNLTALRVQAFVECVNTYMRVVGDSGGGPYRYNFCR